MPTNVEKLQGARNDIADVYASEVKDEVYDNGLLNVINEAIRGLELAIQTLQDRE